MKPPHDRDEEDVMLPEYDLSNAVRGKFYRKDLRLVLPIHLDPELLQQLSVSAESRGISVNTLVNELLRKTIQPADGVR